MKADQPFRFRNYLDRAEELPLLFDPLLDIIGHVESFGLNADEGCLLGIKGDWGAGKTSMLRALQGYFGEGRGWPVVFFEAWKYQDDDNPIFPLLMKLRAVASGPVKGRLTKAVQLLGVAALATGDAALKIATQASLGEKIGIKEIEKAFQLAGKAGIENSSRFDSLFSKLRNLAEDITKNYKPKLSNEWQTFLNWKEGLNQGPSPDAPRLIIIVDDLDRLLPDRAVHLLESIRFFLMLPKIIVVLGINDHILSRSVEIRYCDPRDHQPFFSGMEFMEKLFQWSVELPGVAFQGHMEDLHFSDVKKMLNDNLPKGTNDLVTAIDPLTNRKWVRIANRWESYLSQFGSESTETRLKNLWLAIFHECFPETEKFLRCFPNLNADFMNAHLKDDPDEIITTVKEIINEDKTFLKFPEKNFDALSNAWQALAGSMDQL